MKKSISILVLSFIFFTVSCKKENSPSSGGSGSDLPDAEFTATVTGAENQSYSFTLPKNVANNFAINGSLSSALGVLAFQAMELPLGWKFAFITKTLSLAEGSYKMNEGAPTGSSYSPSTSGSTTYISTSGTINITKSVLYQASSVSDYFLDGNYSMNMRNPLDTTMKVTVNGTFKGVNIKKQ
ncbi:MAG: hypothetical protein H6605_03985 [Flavobacteriales bacterium]|nr:hypothetical protein [Flavobacteriales bacterium]